MTGDGAPRHAGPGGSAGPFGQLIEELLRAAAAAPSMHNTQPWRFRIGDGATIELSLDQARMLPAGDADGRAAHIACGAALLNLRVAAAVAGMQPAIRLLPDPSDRLLMARIRPGGTHHATPWEQELHAAIPRRHTNRDPFSARPVPPGIKAEMADAARLEGATLHFPGHDEALRLQRLAAAAERDLLADPAYRAEIDRWVGGRRDDDGIPGDTLAPRSPEGRAPVRDFRRERDPGSVRYAWFEEHPQLAVLSTPAGRTLDWLAAGQALQRVWLTATCRGISACPLTQPLETANAWMVRDPRSGAEQPQMILRIGYGLPIQPRTSHRPAADITD